MAPTSTQAWTWILAMFGSALVLGWVGLHCSPVPASIAAESAYTASLLRCVDKAETADEAHACRAKVDKDWGIVSIGRRDAGSR